MTSVHAVLGFGLIGALAVGASPGGQTPVIPTVAVDSTVDASVLDGGELLVEEGMTDATVEADLISNEIEQLSADPEMPLITVYDLRQVEESFPGELQALDVASASYLLPDGCEAAVAATVNCGSEALVVTGSVLDKNGNLILSNTEVSDGTVTIRADVDEVTAFPLSFSTYVSDAASAHLVDLAVETMGEMISGDLPEFTEAEIEEEERLLNEAAGIEFDQDGEPQATEKAGDRGISASFYNESAHTSVERMIPGLGSSEGLSVIPAASSRPAKITIPGTYKYCPWTCSPKNLHDYCSWSPDKYGQADFRGPCARHDMGIDSIRKKNISANSKRSQRASVDVTFKGHLRQNCGNGYWGSDSVTKWYRNNCYERTSVYYSVVSSKTKSWNP